MGSKPLPLGALLLVLLARTCSARGLQRALLAAPAAEPPAAATASALDQPPEAAAAAAQAAESTATPGLDSGGCLANAALLEPAANATSQAMAALGTICSQGSPEQCSEAVHLGTPGFSSVWASLFLLTGAEALAKGEHGSIPTPAAPLPPGPASAAGLLAAVRLDPARALLLRAHPPPQRRAPTSPRRPWACSLPHLLQAWRRPAPPLAPATA